MVVGEKVHKCVGRCVFSGGKGEYVRRCVNGATRERSESRGEENGRHDCAYVLIFGT